MDFGFGLPFNAIAYKGGGQQNGMPVVAQGVAPSTMGGILSVNNTTTSGWGFGAVVSRLASAPNEFYWGLVTSGIVAGVLQIDPGIAQNDPAHPTYPLLGQPITVGFDGQYLYTSWRKTVTGAIDPIPGAKLVYNNTSGEIQFVPSSQSADAGWTVLTGGFVANVDELGLSGAMIGIRSVT